MRRARIPFCLLVIASISLLIASSARAEEARVEFTSSNGIHCIVQPMPQAKTATIELFVVGGSSLETPATSGIAHLLEHMIFRRTTGFEKNDLGESIESLGGTADAVTTRDFTRISLSVPRENWQPALERLAASILQPALDPKEFLIEQKVLRVELAQLQEDQQRLLQDAAFQAAFGSHPYRLPASGLPRILTQLTPAEASTFYRQTYLPNNSLLILAGALEPKAVEQVVDQYFGGWAVEVALTPIPVMPPLQAAERNWFRPGSVLPNPALELRRRLAPPATALLALSFRTPPASEEIDSLPLEACRVILGEGAASRLYRSLIQDKNLATEVGAVYSKRRFGSVFYIWARGRPQNSRDMLEGLSDELNSLLSTPPTEAEMEFARQFLLRQYLSRSSTPSRLAQNIGESIILGESVEQPAGYAERLQQLQAEDVWRVAKRYLIANTGIALQL